MVANGAQEDGDRYSARWGLVATGATAELVGEGMVVREIRHHERSSLDKMSGRFFSFASLV